MSNNSVTAGNSVVFLDIEIAQEKSESRIYNNYTYFYQFFKYIKEPKFYQTIS